MIVDVSKGNCIRAAADGDCDTVRRYFEQLPPTIKQHEETPVSLEQSTSENALAKKPQAFLEDMTRTLFSEAITNGHVTVIQVLLSPDVRKCIDGILEAILQDLLVAAIEEDYVEIVECLLAHGADANGAIRQTDDEQTTPLCKATELGSLDIVQALVAHGAHVNVRHETTGRTALHEAAKQGDVDILEFLLAKGADLNVQDYQLRETPLISAVKKGNKNVVSKLIAAKAHLNIANTFGSTALRIANVEGQSEIRQVLEAAGAQVLEVPRTPRR